MISHTPLEKPESSRGAHLVARSLWPQGSRFSKNHERRVGLCHGGDLPGVKKTSGCMGGAQRECCGELLRLLKCGSGESPR